MTATEREWVPGDPLYPQSQNGGAGYRQHLYNFRDDSRNEACTCPDAASWPEPRHQHTLVGDRDELGEFIAHWRQWRRLEESA